MNDKSFYNEYFPEKNRFVARFDSIHTLIIPPGGICRQKQQRFVLADNIDDATEYFMEELNNPSHWDKVNNKWENLIIENDPDILVCQFGVYRFNVDIRKNNL